MPNKVQAYVQKANEMSAGITRDPEAWMQFLYHSARFYKYTFNDVFQKTVTGLTIIKNQEVSLQTQMIVSGLLRLLRIVGEA